jgi:fluoroacetyl-CoA thioesterase
MKPDLKPGLESTFRYTVPENKTVPHLYPEAKDFGDMPKVFATGYMVGLMEWACIDALKPWLDWPREMTLGTHINVSHAAATPPGLEVTVKTKLVEVEGRRLKFEIEAHDGVDMIGRGTHERFVVERDKFIDRLGKKLKK